MVLCKMADAWARLVRIHFLPLQAQAQAQLSSCSMREISGSNRWLTDECNGGSFCAPFVRECAGWPVYRLDLLSDTVTGKTRVTLIVHVDPVRSGLQKEFVRSRFVPVLLACVGLLNEATGKARESVHVTFAAHSARRMLPELVGAAIMPENVNGGVTFIDTQRVLVYREEDACKVLIHELLHLYGYDNKLLYSQAAESRVMLEYGVQFLGGSVGHLGLSECYIDAIACFLHGHVEGSATKDVMMHMDVVATRLLMHYGRDPLSIGSGPHKIVEGTHGFSYYVCKAALWRDIRAFLDAHPPNMMPNNPEAFATLVIGAVRKWSPSRAVMKAAASGSSMRMTP